jgi:hypothetical protein
MFHEEHIKISCHLSANASAKGWPVARQASAGSRREALDTRKTLRYVPFY